MKNMMVIDAAENCVYDIFSIEDSVFETVFPNGQDIEFVEDLAERIGEKKIETLLSSAWKRRLKKKDVEGIHGTLFYGLLAKKQFYPTKRDEEAENPQGTRIRS